MIRSADTFVKSCLQDRMRTDGRGAVGYRKVKIQFGQQFGEVEVTFTSPSAGQTRVLAVVTGEVVTPHKSRPNEGTLFFNVELGAMASPTFEAGRQRPQAATITNFIERLLKGSRAVDTEALCIQGGVKVWSIRVDVHALNDGGNLLDACAIAALAGLLHFRKCDVEVLDGVGQIVDSQERDPVPLSIHHLPIPVSFALFQGQPQADPATIEEESMDGLLCVAVNQHGEICGVHKPGGSPVPLDLLATCTEIAVKKAEDITSKIQQALAEDQAKRAKKKKNVHDRYHAEMLEVDSQLPPIPTAPLAKAPRKPDEVVPVPIASGLGGAGGMIPMDSDDEEPPQKKHKK